MLTIGEFSKACGVTVKTLRHYDKIGLLLPKKVDDLTNYRYYSEQQISDMLLINRLKRYGLSLERIQRLVRNESLISPALHRQKQLLTDDIHQVKATLSELEAHLKDMERTGKIMNYQKNYDITFVEREPLAILSVRQEMGISQFDEAFGQLFEKLGQLRAVPSAPALAIYHDSEFVSEDSDIEVALPISNPAQATRKLPGGLHLCTVHHGSYTNLSEAYAAMVEWMVANHYRSCGAPFEVYEQSAMNSQPIDKWQTAVYFPVEEII